MAQGLVQSYINSPAASDLSCFTKSSHASVRDRPNASVSSISHRTADTLRLLDIKNVDHAKVPVYRLRNVITTASCRHSESCENVIEWLRQKARVRDNKICSGSIAPPVSADPLWISSKKRPDVLWNDPELVLQCEIVSNYDLDKTVTKLSLGLVDQLRSWKNRLSSISSVTGYCFPVDDTSKTAEQCGSCVFEVTLEWLRNEMRYFVSVHPLRAANVWNCIQRMQSQQCVILTSLIDNDNKHFTLPLDEQFVQDTFGADARQVKSGESVVILTTGQAYKYALDPLESLRLQSLCYGDRPNFQGYIPCCLPQHISPMNSKFYGFQRFIQPMPITIIQRDIVEFIDAVVNSLLKLHEEGNIAHLDIRIENICWDNEGNVIFIDLDRSATIDKPAKHICMYGQSLMYEHPKDDWTVKELDFRQLAIMIGHIEGNDEIHTVPPTLNTPFQEKLYSEGELISYSNYLSGYIINGYIL
jgi:hypothetical protein